MEVGKDLQGIGFVIEFMFIRLYRYKCYKNL